MTSSALRVVVQKKQKRFRKLRDSKKSGLGIGEFFFLIDITAGEVPLYVPLSIASGKKPAGFVYAVEGTGKGSLSTTEISCRGAGVTQLTFGTILYAKIPSGKTATFRILINIKGKIGKEYKIIIDRIHYKHDPADARYQKFLEELHSGTLKLS